MPGEADVAGGATRFAMARTAVQSELRKIDHAVVKYPSSPSTVVGLGGGGGSGGRAISSPVRTYSAISVAA